VNESLATLLAAVITLIPWIVGLYMARRRRIRAQERRRPHKAHRKVSKLVEDVPTLDEPVPRMPGRVDRGSDS
jgi:hypothetical protein